MAIQAVSIRQLSASDAEAFSDLRRSVVAHHAVGMGLSMEEELTRPIDGFRNQLSLPAPNASFGAFQDEVLLGHAAVAWPSKFASSRHRADLWGVFVRPEARRQGLGRLLVQRAVRHALEQGVRRVNLLVYVPNPEAVALYESLGFILYGREPQALFLNGQFHDGIHMSLLKDDVRWQAQQ